MWEKDINISQIHEIRTKTNVFFTTVPKTSSCTNIRLKLSKPINFGVCSKSYELKLKTIEEIIGIMVKSRKNIVKGASNKSIGACSLIP